MVAFLANMKDTLFERLLKHYKIDEKGYQDLIAPVTIDSFASGHNFKDMDKAVALTKEAIANKDKIFIYGDYDADAAGAHGWFRCRYGPDRLP